MYLYRESVLMEIEKVINKDLILRENLAIQRTVLANQATFLAFLRTSMYFLIAGLSLHNIFTMTETAWLEILFYFISGILLTTGIFNYLFQRKKIEASKRHVGHYQMDYLNK